MEKAAIKEGRRISFCEEIRLQREDRGKGGRETCQKKRTCIKKTSPEERSPARLSYHSITKGR